MSKTWFQPPIIVGAIVAVLAIVMIFKPAAHSSEQTRGTYYKMPFICTECQTLQKIEYRDLAKLNLPPNTRPVLTCPKCGKKTSIPAAECPNCQTLFLVKTDAQNKVLNDTCPKCGQSYNTAWKQKYGKPAPK